MKITIEGESVTATVENKNAITFDELLDMFKQCAVGAGFHPDTVKEYLDDDLYDLDEVAYIRTLPEG